MTALIEGQYAQLKPHRAGTYLLYTHKSLLNLIVLVLFGMINDSGVKALWKYRALTALTNYGRDISPFEVNFSSFSSSLI
jgi:hypothetical protein